MKPKEVTVTISVSENGLTVVVGKDRIVHPEELHELSKMIIAFYHVAPQGGVWLPILTALNCLGKEYHPLSDD